MRFFLLEFVSDLLYFALKREIIKLLEMAPTIYYCNKSKSTYKIQVSWICAWLGKKIYRTMMHRESRFVILFDDWRDSMSKTWVMDVNSVLLCLNIFFAYRRGIMLDWLWIVLIVLWIRSAGGKKRTRLDTTLCDRMSKFNLIVVIFEVNIWHQMPNYSLKITCSEWQLSGGYTY